MKVGIDISQIVYPGTGVGMYTKSLVNSLQSMINSHDLVLFGSSLRMQNSLRAFNKSTRVFPFPPTVLDILWNRLHVLPIEDLVGEVDVFHTSDWTEPPSKKAKKVTTIHDMVVYKFPNASHQKIVSTVKKKLEWVKKESSLIIADSLSTKKDIVEILGVDEKKIRVIYPGLTPGFEDYKPKSYSGRPYILAVGTREPRKNLERLVDAFKSLKLKDYDLVIAGKYGWGDDISADNIRVLGYVSEESKRELFAHASLFCYPSLYEGFGFPILEAMSLGCPVLTSNVGSMPEVAGEAGIYIDPNSVDDIASKIKISLTKDVSKQVAKGYEQVKHFTWAKTAAETVKVYKDACGC